METCVIPDELKQPVPRQTRIIWAVRALPVFMTLIIGSFVWGLWQSHSQNYRLEALKAHGLQVEGQITRVSLEKEPCGRHYCTYCYVDYQYSPSLTASPDRSSSVIYNHTHGLAMTQTCQMHTPGQPISIIYDPAQPNDSITRDAGMMGATAADHHMIDIMAIVFLSGMMFFWIWSLLRMQKLLQTGTVVVADVVSTKVYSGRNGKWTTIECQFKDRLGTLIKAKKRVNGDRTTDKQVVLIHDPQNSSRNLIYPAYLVRCIMPKKNDVVRTT